MQEQIKDAQVLVEDSIHTLIEDAREGMEQMFCEGKHYKQILYYLATVAEQVSGTESAASILVLDNNNQLRDGGSPRLPADYLKAIDGLRPAPQLGTCCHAAATGEIVFTPDFLTDEKWAELKHLPRSIGYAGAWSVPIKDNNGKVLGTFGTYFRERRTPSPTEIYVNKQLALLAAEAIEKGAQDF